MTFARSNARKCLHRGPWAALVLAGAVTLLAPARACAQAGPAFGEAPPAGLGGAIDLVDQESRAFHLPRLARGGTLVFFGYTHCGTTCPTALLTARQVLAATRGSATVLFVTLDPMSDPPSELRRYLHGFDDRIVGLTGTPGAVMRVAERYGVGVERDSGSIGHSAKWYLLDRQGRLVRVYAVDTPAGELASDVARVSQDTTGGFR